MRKYVMEIATFKTISVYAETKEEAIEKAKKLADTEIRNDEENYYYVEGAICSYKD